MNPSETCPANYLHKITTLLGSFSLISHTLKLPSELQDAKVDLRLLRLSGLEQSGPALALGRELRAVSQLLPPEERSVSWDSGRMLHVMQILDLVTDLEPDSFRCRMLSPSTGHPPLRICGPWRAAWTPQSNLPTETSSGNTVKSWHAIGKPSGKASERVWICYSLFCSFGLIFYPVPGVYQQDPGGPQRLCWRTSRHGSPQQNLRVIASGHKTNRRFFN